MGFLIGCHEPSREKKKSSEKEIERIDLFKVVQYLNNHVIISSFLSRGRGGQVDACVGVLAVSRRNEGVARSIDWACLLPSSSFFSCSALSNVLSYTRTYPHPRVSFGTRTITSSPPRDNNNERTKRGEKKGKK